jgi:hypothetical protein
MAKKLIKNAIEQLHGKSDDVLRDMEAVLEKHGIQGVAIDRIGLFVKTGAALACPEGKTAVFRCALTPNGEMECKWVCE